MKLKVNAEISVSIGSSIVTLFDPKDAGFFLQHSNYKPIPWFTSSLNLNGWRKYIFQYLLLSSVSLILHLRSLYSHYQKIKPLTKIMRFFGIASYCIVRSLRLHHTYCFSSVTSLNDLFSTQVNRIDIFSGFVLNFSNFKNCENGSKKVTQWSSKRPNCCFA